MGSRGPDESSDWWIDESLPVGPYQRFPAAEDITRAFRYISSALGITIQEAAKRYVEAFNSFSPEFQAEFKANLTKFAAATESKTKVSSRPTPRINNTGPRPKKAFQKGKKTF